MAAAESQDERSSPRARASVDDGAVADEATQEYAEEEALSEEEVARQLAAYIGHYGVVLPGESRPSLASTQIAGFYRGDARRKKTILEKGNLKAFFERSRAFVEWVALEGIKSRIYAADGFLSAASAPWVPAAAGGGGGAAGGRGTVVTLSAKGFGYVRPDGATRRDENLKFAVERKDAKVLAVGAAVSYDASEEGDYGACNVVGLDGGADMIDTPASEGDAAAARGVVVKVSGSADHEFGFIQPEGATRRHENVYFPLANAETAVTKGDRVLFKVTRDNGRVTARWVAKDGDAPPPPPPLPRMAPGSKATKTLSQERRAGEPLRPGAAIDRLEDIIKRLADAERRAAAAEADAAFAKKQLIQERQRADAACKDLDYICTAFSRHCEKGIEIASRAQSRNNGK